MAEEFDFRLPEAGGGRRAAGGARATRLLLGLVLAAAVANLALALRGGAAPGGARHGADLRPAALKELALKCEQQGLLRSAVTCWKEYLKAARPGPRARARIWYRVGKLLQERHEPERALLAYYRSEAACKLDELASEIGPRVQDCLEMAGRFAAVDYELRGRVGTGRDGAGQEVLAEIGTRKITRAVLDRMIETRVRNQLQGLAGVLSAGQRRQRQRELVRRFTTPQMRRRLLRELVFGEMLYRRARAQKLDRRPEVRALLADNERALLAQMVLRREVGEKIQVLPSEIQSYYQAHQQEFMDRKAKPPKLRPLDEVQAGIYAKLYAQKEQVLQASLFARLQDEYNVVIHARLVGGEGGQQAPAGPGRGAAAGKRQGGAKPGSGAGRSGK